MAARTRLRKLGLALCSTILLGIQCPPIVMDAFKSGVTSWVSGSVGSIDLTQFTDVLIASFTGNDPTP